MIESKTSALPRSMLAAMNASPKTAVRTTTAARATPVAVKTALLFPGQGSQKSDMREAVAEHCPNLLALACDLVGVDPFESIAGGTSFQQPALYCASIAGWRAAGSPDADFCVGHSLGELAAAAAARSISVEDGLRLSVARGRAMQKAAEAEPGGMLAVLGAGHGVATLACSIGLTVANDNAPDQVVLSGPSDSISEARRRFRESGIRTVRLPIVGAFHSQSMQAAEAEFASALESVEVREPRTCLLSSITTKPFTDLRAGLLSALTKPVRWRETVLYLRDKGVTRFAETGPGEVLSGLVRRTVGDVEIVPLIPTDAQPEAARV
jgi:[acyl-carrier-protein] S-malonyltransferase